MQLAQRTRSSEVAIVSDKYDNWIHYKRLNGILPSAWCVKNTKDISRYGVSDVGHSVSHLVELRLFIDLK